MMRLNSFEKFTISSKPVLVTYIHGGVFVPVTNAPSDASHYTFSLSNNTSVQLKYWDEEAYVSELVLSTAEDDAAQEQKANKITSNHGDGQAKDTKDSDKGKKRRADATTSASTKKLAMPPQLQFWSDRHAELHGINRDAVGNPAEGSNSAASTTDTAALVTDTAARTTDLETQTDLVASVAPSFADWGNLRCLLCEQDFVNEGHLRAHENGSVAHFEKLQDVDMRIRGVCLLIIWGVIPMPTPNYEGSRDGYRDEIEKKYWIPPSPRSFADLNRGWCLLCFSNFDPPEELFAHDRISEHHRKQLQDQDEVEWGLSKLKEAGIAQDIGQAGPRAPGTPEYRDRAEERRQAFGHNDANTNQRAPAQEEDESPVQTTSIGASLLNRMGWTEGSGLGAQGTGVTEPIPTEVYAQGVGLGAPGSRLGEATEEAGRNTRGRYEEFLERTRDTARQRYEDMDRS